VLGHGGCAESARASPQPRRTGCGLRCRAIPGDSRDSLRRGRRRRCVAWNRGPIPTREAGSRSGPHSPSTKRIQPTVFTSIECDPFGCTASARMSPAVEMISETAIPRARCARRSFLDPRLSSGHVRGRRVWCQAPLRECDYSSTRVREVCNRAIRSEPGRCQAPLPKREFFDVARRAVRSHRRRRVSVHGSCPRRRNRGTRRRPRCLPR
jgi:hypothetical protein